MVIFKYKQKKFEDDLKIRFYDKNYISQNVSNSWESKLNLMQCQFNDLSIKLYRVNALLFKIRKHVSPTILRSVYFTISILTYLTALLSGLRFLELFNGL